MLEELGIVDRAMMVHDECGELVIAQHDVRRVAEKPAIEVAWGSERSAHDGVRRVVVLRQERRIQVDRVDARIPAAGRENVRPGQRASSNGEDQADRCNPEPSSRPMSVHGASLGQSRSLEAPKTAMQPSRQSGKTLLAGKGTNA